MLNKDWISNVEIYSEDWHVMRLGKFTSSKIHNLCTQKQLSQDGVSYIHQKVGELVTGQSASDEDEQIEDENTAWGVVNEPLGMNEFARLLGIKFLVTGKVIHQPGSRFSSTPDGIWIINSSVTKENHYNVATLELKCPKKYPRFIPLFQCKTPADLKKRDSKYFWQVLDQMDNCCASVGYFAAFHPLFPAPNNIRIIEFRKIDLWDDFVFLQQRKKLALEIFGNVYSEFLVQKA